MTKRLVRCRVLRDGRQIEHGDLTIHVDLDEGDPELILKAALRDAVLRDGNGTGPIALYQLQLFDHVGDVIGNYVVSE